MAVRGRPAKLLAQARPGQATGWVAAAGLPASCWPHRSRAGRLPASPHSPPHPPFTSPAPVSIMPSSCVHRARRAAWCSCGSSVTSLSCASPRGMPMELPSAAPSTRLRASGTLARTLRCTAAGEVEVEGPAGSVVRGAG